MQETDCVCTCLITYSYRDPRWKSSNERETAPQGLKKALVPFRNMTIGSPRNAVYIQIHEYSLILRHFFPLECRHRSMSVISEPLSRMEALPCFSKSLLLFWLTFWLTTNVEKGFSFQIGRQGRQLAPRTETVARTITVAVTEITFETKANLCVSLINATRPCVGRQVDWTRIPSHLKEAVNPTIIQK